MLEVEETNIDAREYNALNDNAGVEILYPIRCSPLESGHSTELLVIGVLGRR